MPTRFPNGVSLAAEGATEHYPVGNITEGGKIGSIAGTVITGGGTIAPSAFGLVTVTAVVAGLGGTTPFAGTAATIPVLVKGNAVGGSAAVRLYDNTGAQASAAGTVDIIAYGT